jgi:hypothetical protein
MSHCGFFPLGVMGWAVAGLFGGDVRRRLGEIGRTLLEETCECLFGFCGADALTELLHFDSTLSVLNRASKVHKR